MMTRPNRLNLPSFQATASAKARWISSPMIRIPVPSVLDGWLNGSSRATRHLLIRARSASGQVARGDHLTSSGSRPEVCRRPARTLVLPTPRVPDGLTITRFANEAADTRAPKSSCRITAFASASIALSWTSFTGSRSARRSITRSTSCRPISTPGWSTTIIGGRIRAAGALARVESRCGAVAVGRSYLVPPLSFGGASLVRPCLRFHIPLIERDRRICRVAQPLLAFAPTDPTVRRYRSGLFRTDLRRVDHLCHA
jgi:hypothetical protein